MKMFGDYLDEIMRKTKTTNLVLSEYLSAVGKEIGQNAIAKYRNNDRTPPPETIRLIASYFNIPEQYFFDGMDQLPVVPIPVVGTASCGEVESNHLQDGDRVCYYNGQYFKSSLYCVIANGDSMCPEIEDGDEIVCDPDVQPQSGDIVHYTIHGESAVKVFVEDKDANIVQLVPYNATNTFKTRTIRLDDDEALDLKLSKVVAVNKLKFNNRASRLRLIGRM